MPPRADYVFNVYVDALHGDDQWASAANPRTSGGALNSPLSQHPDADPNNMVGGLLNHAPYSFRTLRAAILWVQNSGLLGYSVSYQGAGTKTIEWVVVHCLPGLYGPLLAGQPDIDPASGLRFNGDTFPITVPYGVVVQGNSILDTIFDARFQGVNVFQLKGRPLGQSVRRLMIDSVTIRNARCDPQAGPYNSGAAIRIDVDGHTDPIISNCVIHGNEVGIALLADNASNLLLPQIVNNTIADNLGNSVWNGSTGAPSIGWGKPLLLNNIFATPFAGIHPDDLRVTTIGSLGPNLDFNAYSVVNRNGSMSSMCWPPTTPRNMPLPPFAPVRVDLDGVPTAHYFINKVFAASGNPRAAFDYRLAPVISATGTPSPFVNMGADTAPGVIALANGGGISGPPGLPGSALDLVSEPWQRYDAWDWDGEGWGNRRIQARTGFTVGLYSNIDLGADELGDLVVAGYVDSTRIFTRIVAGVPTDRDKIYFFNLPGSSYPRPTFNNILGRVWGWYGHATTYLDVYPQQFVNQTPTNSPWRNNPNPQYTAGKVWTSPPLPPPGTNTGRYALVELVPQQNRSKPPFLRNLECDYSPHLLADLHPFWAAYLGSSIQAQDHLYASNPWFDDPQNWTYRSLGHDNPFLYYNPSPGYHRAGSTYNGNTWLSNVITGSLNPPGTTLPSGTAATLPLPDLLMPASLYPRSQFGPWSPCLGSSLYTLNSWGYGDFAAGCPDRVPAVPQENLNMGLRINCLLNPGGGTAQSNLQTFLMIDPIEIAQSGSSGSSNRGKITPSTGPSLLAIEEHRSAVQARLRR